MYISSLKEKKGVEKLKKIFLCGYFETHIKELIVETQNVFSFLEIAVKRFFVFKSI